MLGIHSYVKCQSRGERQSSLVASLAAWPCSSAPAALSHGSDALCFPPLRATTLWGFPDFHGQEKGLYYLQRQKRYFERQIN